jgi:L-fuconolactonase
VIDASPVIDAHQHFWDPATADYPWLTDEVASLRRRYGPEDLEPELQANGIACSVAVQARSSLEDTHMLLELAAGAPFVAGVVGWVDLTGDVPAQLAALPEALVGVRHQVHDEDDSAWLLRDDVQRGIAALGDAGLPFDLLVRTRELPAAIETVRRNATVTFVLDHVAKPPLRTGELGEWARNVAALAALPNVVCKLSGLVTEAEPGTDFAPVIEQALAWFGPERCMFGSDWPVCLLAAGYADVLALVRELVPESVLSATAIRVYRLGVAC